MNCFLLLPTIFLFSASFPPILLFTPTAASHHHHHPIHPLGNETDRLSLLAFKHHLDDPQQAMSSWNGSTHFCQWEGVTCSRRHQRVVALELYSRGLVGPISPYIGNLSFLRYIYLENNTLQGNIPHEISHLFRLKVLSLYNNSLEGQIPTNLVQCSNLEYLYLDGNKLLGRIPNEFGSFPKLVDMWVYNNNLIGGIPAALGNLSSLEYLHLGENHLDGSIPYSLGQLKRLTFLALNENMLSGMVPPSIYNLSVLQVIGLDDNQLEGSLPPSIGHHLPSLQEFIIGGNQFSGSLPVSLFKNASLLVRLEVCINKFVGQVPIEVGNLKEIMLLRFDQNNLGSGGKDNDLHFITSLINCTNLETLKIDYNNFGGRLPASLTNLSVTLNTLYLGNNQIFGSIPSDMWKLNNLMAFGASNNFLTGTIPKEIGMLQKLQYLGLGKNKLSGKIPNTIENLTSLYWLYLPHNKLEGNVESSLGKCRSLQRLSINHNRFTGIIPKQILGLSINLLEIDMSDNYWIGPLPQEVGELKNLISLKLSTNKLSGEIPTTLSSCLSLEVLDLAGNSFQGPIPSSFDSFISIKEIDLSRNNLSGEIPKDLENLSSLEYLNISFNNFEGEVPVKGIFQNVTAFDMVGNDKLCGGSDKLKLPKCHIQKSKKKEFTMVLKVIIGVLISISVIATLLVLLVLHLRKNPSDKSFSKMYANEFQRVSYNEIREATNGFSSDNLIGTGSYASIYKGVLRVDGSVIAAKVFNHMERRASKGFKAECEVLRRIRHRNLLKILTVCSSVDFDGNDFKALILEFMPNGSLQDWLHPSSDRSQRLPKKLNILQMINIAIDVACALDYLHNHNEAPIVHCDLKPSNVLLDKDLIAFVGDFGITKILNKNNSSFNRSETSSIAVRGTVGYIPPEYGMGSTVSTQGDVYSYGIMLLEMFTGKRPTDEMFCDTLSLHNFCKVNLVEGDKDILNINPIVEQNEDDTIVNIEEQRSMAQSMKKCLLSVIEIGVACSSEAISDRMEIKDVLIKMQRIREAFVKVMIVGENTDMESHI